MTYSYSTPLTYGTQEPLTYDYQQADTVPQNVTIKNTEQTQQKTPSTKSAAIGGAVVGLGAGAATGCVINPYMKKGVPTDSFTKRTYKKYIKKAPDNIKKTHIQSIEILNKLDKISTADELKKLFSDNPEGAKDACSSLNQTPEEFLRDINNSNLSQNKKVIKDKLEASENVRIQDIKNKITNYWNPDKNKFEQPANGNSDIFNAIKRSKRGMKLVNIAKWGGIGAIGGSIIAVLAQQLFSHKKDKKS